MSGHLVETSGNIDALSTSESHEPRLSLSPTSNGILTNGQPDEPPLKRRKLTDSSLNSTTKPRPVSPPWKKITIDGPTSFVENGRRKSSRTNTIPRDLQPDSDKRRTRAALHKVNDDKTKHLHRLSVGPSGGADSPQSELTRSRPASSSKTQARARDTGRNNTYLKSIPLRNGIDARPDSPPFDGRQSHVNYRGSKKHLSSPETSPEKHLNARRTETSSPNNSRHSQDATTTDHSLSLTARRSTTPSKPTSRLQKIRLSVKMPTVAIQHPDHVVQKRHFSSFREWLANDPIEPRAGQGGWATNVVEEKAEERFHVMKAQRLGGLLTDEKFVGPEKHEIAKRLPEEPPQQHGHYQHLVAHAIHLRRLQESEVRRHKTQAKRLATQALDHPLHSRLQKLRRMAEPHVEITKEMLEKEQQEFQLVRYKRLLRDLQKQWASATAEVRSLLFAEWEEDQRARGQEHLHRLVEHHTKMLETRNTRTEEGDDELGDASSESHHYSEDDSNMSTSSDTGSSEPETVDDDRNLTADELQAKYASLLDHTPPVEDADVERKVSSDISDSDYDSHSENSFSNGGMDSDESIGTTNSDNNNSHEDHDESHADAKGSLLGFYQADQREMVVERALQDNISQPPPQNDDPSIRHQTENTTQARSTSVETTAHVDQDVDSSTTIAAVADEGKSPKSFPDDRVRIPSLLRATLREYQHDGLDWLVRLYEKGHNGILADEMGLGKTIQSIALLAHLAVEHEVWGPHLIIVPTSVMLNWELEFKKFLPGFKIMTYYGTIEERKQKRRGWMDDDLWNVCITSYQLVLQDQQPFRRRRWHYMILDEAHNIKNFQSQRWQALLGFNTRARLLLTGTPLQNNLSELWSLLFFLNGATTFTDLEEFKGMFGGFSRTVLEYGRESMDDQDRERVLQLQIVLRPYLLRRLKADVEKQMPAKYEHVEMCRLSNRQRQLYDGFMSRAQTKETLASGNYLSIMNCLMQLRKVCNHPDLFETRPITTSFAMPRAATADFEVKELLVRRKLLRQDLSETVNFHCLRSAPISYEARSSTETLDSSRLTAYVQFQKLRHEQHSRANWSMRFNGSSIRDVLASLENVGRQVRMAELETCLFFESQRHRQHVLYDQRFLHTLRSAVQSALPSPDAMTLSERESWQEFQPGPLQDIAPFLDQRALDLHPIIQKFACVTPAVIAPNMSNTVLTKPYAAKIQEICEPNSPNPYHEAQTRLSIAFPDKRLLQYDCGKLQRLDKLLRELQAGGHRALIFTQMTKVLDILEQFLNIHGHRYLRLDGATKVEQRQALTDRFNNDNRILAFILSSRSGGLGINLTGADTVIFYDLDWNPAMDKQCQDRCHRIGQTRDVHIYRFVSEHTIESNILKKANQKRMLDDVIIQEGEFTTDYFNKLSVRDMVGDDSLVDEEHLPGLDRVFGSAKGGIGAAFSQVEDREDAAAARVAEKEVQHADEVDFEEKTSMLVDKSVTPKTPRDPSTPMGGALGLHADDPAIKELDAVRDETEDSEVGGHIDAYLIRMMKWLLKDEPVALMGGKKTTKKGPKKGMEHLLPRRAR